MRVLVLYASDLSALSRVAPGGITSNLRGYLGGLPRDWDIEAWGVVERGMGEVGIVQTIPLAGRTIRLLPLVAAGPAAERQVALSPRYTAALLSRVWRQQLGRERWDVLVAHRTEYLAAASWARPINSLPSAIAMIHSSATYHTTMGPLRGRAQVWGERLAISRASAVALVSGAALPHYRTLYPRYADRFYWIPNGVDCSRFAGSRQEEWRERHGFRLQDRLLVYHGRYDHEKGVQRMLDVLRILLADGAPWHLVCAGIGPLSTLLAGAAGGWAAGRVHDLGYLPPVAIAELLGAGDLGLLLSDFEGLSNGLLEALAAGLPVIATDVGDNKIVLDHLAPQLVGDRRPMTLAAAVRWAWEHRDRLAPLARAAAERFSLEARISRLTSLIQHVASGQAQRFEAN